MKILLHFLVGFSLLGTEAVATDQETAGIGVALGKLGEDLVVRRIVPESEAARGRALSVGDRIVEVAQGNMPPIEVKGWKIEDVVRLIRGPKATVVRLTIIPSGKEESQARVVSFVRGELKQLARWGDGVPMEVGTKAPNIQMIALFGQGLEPLTNYFGKVVLLDFWATWCGPCQRQVAALQSYADKYPDWSDKVVLITASVDDTKDTASQHVKAKGWAKTHNVWVGPDASKAYHVGRLPTTYILDKRGRIAAADFEGGIPELVNRLIHKE